MEHNIERLLQSKILAEESKQMVWRKDATWARIQTDITAKNSPSVYYYAYAAAACVSLLLVFFGYRRYQSIIMMERLDSLAVCIEALKTENDLPPKSANLIPEVCESGTGSPTKVQLVRNAAPVLQKKEPASHDEIPPQTPVEEPMIAIAVSDADTVSLPDNKQVTQRVRPIIGVIMDSPKEPVLTDKKKKSKIRFLSREKDAPMLDVLEATTLMARIN